MARIDPFELLSYLESELEDDMGYNHPSRKLINAIRESVICESPKDVQKLQKFLEKERVRNE